MLIVYLELPIYMTAKKRKITAIIITANIIGHWIKYFTYVHFNDLHIYYLKTLQMKFTVN